jgi:ATP-binding cassette subfamily C (CFTR/MRP) protein 1
MTEIGEKGINLSGGQRQRVSLARCIYSEPEILLLDDPLSAVDAHVGKHIFENCIVNRPCARVLVTHQLQYLKYADRVYVMSKGEIIESGSFDELMSQENGELKRMIGENMVVSDVEQVTEHVATEVKQEGERVASPLMQEEERESGSTITLPLLKSLVSLMGGIPIIVLILFAYIATQTASIMTDFVLAQWTSGKYIVVLGFAGYLALYGGMGIFTSLLTFIRDLSLLGSGMRLSYKIHGLALERVLAAPMSFFDTTPLGRMLSRFSKDQENVDNNMFLVLAQFIQGMVSAALTFVLITVITPWFIIPLLPTLVVYIIFQQLFHKTTREVKRLDSLYRSPLYAHFSESLSGITTIRAFDDETRFKGEHMSRLDITQRLFMTNIMCQRWVAIRLEFLGHILVACSAVAAVLAKGSVEAALLALALTNSMQVTSSLAWSIRMSTEVENSMNNYERLYHYTKNIPNEGLPEEKETDPSWPTHGKIRFQNAVLRYRPDLPAVLRGVDFTIKPGEHVGVVGRTGAGKTSIMMALYRLYELTAGRIQIDDVDISRVTLENLRNHLSIIPQEPILFQGTIRSNLDPFNEYDDHQVWKALEKSHMKEFIESDRLGSLQLLNQVNEGGENLSVGQRQLLCLARALLRQSKILVLDEATASVDLETDALIQQTIRVEFKHCTRLTIAHRINTIIDSDKLLVMDKGEVVEFDTPKKLIQRPNGVFASMVQGTGEQNANMLTNIALGAVDVDITELLRADHTDELQKAE